MKTHRVAHDFSELSYEDIEGLSYVTSPKNALRTSPYTFLLAALAVGLLFGMFTRHKQASSSSL